MMRRCVGGCLDTLKGGGGWGGWMCGGGVCEGDDGMSSYPIGGCLLSLLCEELESRLFSAADCYVETIE